MESFMSDSMLIFFGAILLFVVLKLLFGKNNAAGLPYKYVLNKTLFTPAERSFLGVLDLAVADQYRIFGKVRVADILLPRKGLSKSHWQIAFNKVSAKHFDFVLCNKQTLEVIAVIELDDKSHQKAKLQHRDSLIASACATAGLPLVRFVAKSSYQVTEIQQQIQAELTAKSA
jgi:hypothetical protein